MLHTKLVEIGPPVPEKIFYMFLPYMGLAEAPQKIGFGEEDR